MDGPHGAQRNRALLVCILLLGACSSSSTRADPSLLDAPLDGTSPSYCNPLQEGSCGSDTKCTVVGDVFDCGPAGNLAYGSNCDVALDRCVDGSRCVDSVCRQFCARAASALCASGLCAPSLPNEALLLLVKTCSVECVPGGTPCPATTACFLPLDAAEETPGCLPPGERGEGEGCEYPSHCAEGLTCANETNATLGYPSCRPICIVDQLDCDGGEVCTERHPGDGYGVCL